MSAKIIHCNRRASDNKKQHQNNNPHDQRPPTYHSNTNASASEKPPSNSWSYEPSYKFILASKGYIVKQSIGSGSYSKVKLASDVNNGGRRVAIKIIDKLKAPRDYQDKFMPRELAIWPRLHNNFLVNLHKFFEDEYRVFMIMDYGENGDALTYVQTNGALDEECSCKWFNQTVNGVAYLHAYDIAHRDLKLENLILDSNWNIKVCDFGFVKDYCSSRLSTTYCGSKSYAAPEILLGQPYVPKKVDIWALGVILYIFVTGKMPFDESRGTRFILKEQKTLNFIYPKCYKIPINVRKLIRYCFTWEFDRRPDIDFLVGEPWLANYKDFNKGSTIRTFSR